MKPQGSTSNRGWLVAANKVFWLKELHRFPAEGEIVNLVLMRWRRGKEEEKATKEEERGGEDKEGGEIGGEIRREYQIVLVARPQIPLQREITGVMMILRRGRRKRCMMWNTDQMRMTMNIELEYLNVLTEELIAQVD